MEICLDENLPGQPVDLRRKAWKKALIDVLKKSPSEDRKFLRWEITRYAPHPVDGRAVNEVLEAGQMEVLPEPSL